MSTKTNTQLMLLLLLLIIITATLIITNKSGHFGFHKMKSIEQLFFILNLFHSSAVTKLAFVGYMSKVDALLKQSYIFF